MVTSKPRQEWSTATRFTLPTYRSRQLTTADVELPPCFPPKGVSACPVIAYPPMESHAEAHPLGTASGRDRHEPISRSATFRG